MGRTGIISRCDALGSWIVVAQRENGYYTLPLTHESIEPYLFRDENGKLKHRFEGKRVNFKLKIEKARFVSENFYADILNPLEPIKRIDSHIFIFG